MDADDTSLPASSVVRKPSYQEKQTQQPTEHTRNKDLSKDEKKAKRYLKKRLKQQTRLRKYEMRLRQAVARGDVQTADRARRELREYRQLVQGQQNLPDRLEEKDSSHQNSPNDPNIGQGDALPPPTTIFDETRRIREGRLWIVNLYDSLIRFCFEQNQNQPEKPPTTSAQQGDAEGSNRPSSSSREQTIEPQSIPKRPKSNNKEFQTSQARELLSNMTKGTQTEHMFENRDALMGYTRQKFVERAMLCVLSLERLFVQPSLVESSSTSTSPQSRDGHNDNSSGTIARSTVTAEALTTTITTTSRSSGIMQSLHEVKTLCSIGCGPGCDAIGVLSFLYTLSNDQSANSYESGIGVTGQTDFQANHIQNKSDEGHQNASTSNIGEQRGFRGLKRLILMDYVMPQWKHLVLDPLAQNILIPRNYVEQVDMATCDVRCSLLSHPSNNVALRVLLSRTSKELQDTTKPALDHVANQNVQLKRPSKGQCPVAEKEESTPLQFDRSGATGSTVSSSVLSLDSFSDVDLIVVSYVLTETRGKWHDFFSDLVLGKPTEKTTPIGQVVRSGTLFLMSEPTAWQLHHWLQIVGDRLSDYEWLDSSRLAPELQALENRIGPAVLLARIK